MTTCIRPLPERVHETSAQVRARASGFESPATGDRRRVWRRVHAAVTAAPGGRSTVRPSSPTSIPSSAPPRPASLPPAGWPRRGGGPSRRSATPIRAPRHRSAWCRPARTPAPTRPATAATPRTPRACPTRCSRRRRRPGSRTSSSRAPARSASTTTTCGSRRWCSRSTTSASRGRCTTRRPTPGYYAATLDTGVHCEITVGEKVAVHRYTFPEARSARVVLDLSCGGLAIEHGRTVPLRAHVESMGYGRAQGTVVMEGVPLSVYLEVHRPGWRQMLWYDRRLIEGGTRLDFDSIRQTTLRPFGLLFMGPGRAGQTVEVRMGFSLRGCEQARENLWRECGGPEPVFDVVRARHRGALGRPPRPGPGRRRHARPAHGHGDGALPLADQAVLRRRREPVLADVRAVRVRRLHDVGHLQDPDPAAHGDRPEPGRGPAGVADPGLRGGGQLPDRLPDGPRRGPVLPAGQRARPHRAGRRALARARRPGLELGAGAHGGRPAPPLRRGLLRARRRAPDHAHPRPGLRPPLHREGRPGAGRQAPGRRPGDAQPAVGQRLRPGDGPAARLRVLRGRQVELLVPAAARHARADRAGRRRRRLRRDARRVLRLRRGRGDPARPAPRPRPRWPPATRSTGSRG